jgi:uncharacterized protein (TIGR02996 family)
VDDGRRGRCEDCVDVKPLSDDERQAFLRKIIAEPDDDLPRLVYADRLDEAGDCARAEFIRIGCELGNSGYGTKSVSEDDQAFAGRIAALRDRYGRLVGENVSAEPSSVWPRYCRWCHEDRVEPRYVLTPGFGIGADDIANDHFRRGFAWGLTCPAGWFFRNASRLFRAIPVGWVVLTTWPRTSGMSSWPARLPPGFGGIFLAGLHDLAARYQSFGVRAFICAMARRLGGEAYVEGWLNPPRVAIFFGRTLELNKEGGRWRRIQPPSVTVDFSGLTTGQVDSAGYLRPGVPLTLAD